MYYDLCADGLLVRGSSIEDGGQPFVQFGDDVPIALSSHVRNLRAAQRHRHALAGAWHLAAWKGQDGIARKVARGQASIENHGQAYGDESVALTPSGTAARVINQTTYEFGSGIVRDIPAHRIGTSQGIASAADDGTIVWGDDQLYAPASESTLGGFRFLQWQDHGDWRIGKTDKGAIAWHRGRQKAYVITDANTPWAIRGHIVAGSLVCVTSLPAQVIHERQMREYVAPVWVDPDPPCVVPEFAVPNHPIRVAVFGEPGFNLATGSAQHDDPNVASWGVFCTMERDDFASKAAGADKLGVPLFAYTDSDTFDGATAEQLAKFYDVIGCVQYYPSGKHQRILDSVGFATHATSDVAIVAAAYRQIDGNGFYAWTLLQVLARLVLAWETACTHRAVQHVLVFHQDRASGKDGVVSRPEFIEAVRRMKAAAAAYVPIPTPPTPPVPVPIPSSPSIRSFMPFPKIVGLRLAGVGMLSSEPGHEDIEFRDVAQPTAWQQVELTETAEQRIHARFVASDRILAVTNAHGLETRPPGTTGPWETFAGGTMPSGETFLLRPDRIGATTVVLEVVEP